MSDFIMLDKGGTTGRYWQAEEEQERLAHETCITCGEKGHDKRSCTHELCLACGALDDHKTRDCIEGLTCFRCGGRGHRQFECQQPRRKGIRAGFSGRECMRCGSTNHLDANCPSLWRQYYYNDEEAFHSARKAKWRDFDREEGTSRRSAISSMEYRSDDEDVKIDEGKNEGKANSPPLAWDPAERWCYNCAARGSHWGDDCPEPRCNLSRPTGEPSAYSEHLASAGPYASRYAMPPPLPPTTVGFSSLAERIGQVQVGQNASIHIVVDTPDDQHMLSQQYVRRMAKEEQGAEQMSRKDRIRVKLEEEAKAREQARKAFTNSNTRSDFNGKVKKRKKPKRDGRNAA